MPAEAREAINHYANAMFRHERLNPRWIESCAGYLRHVFGDRLEGKIVVDYAFGRGNWSVALLKAGAKRVIAIDAARDNVARFADYCREEGLRAIEVVHGNVLDRPIEAGADVVWLYGILHHVEQDEEFLYRIREMAPGDDALFYVYAYDRGSVRETVVEACRAFVTYADEESFRARSLCLTRPARMRARDDLTAPFIHWYGAEELAALLRTANLVPVSRAPGYEAWLGREGDGEFAPHQWLCSRSAACGMDATDAPNRHAGDIAVLAEMAEAAHALDLTVDQREQLGLGLFNTHFTTLDATGRVEDAIVEDFLFLFYVLHARDACPPEGGCAAGHVELARLALHDADRSGHPAAAERTAIARHLVRNRIRV